MKILGIRTNSFFSGFCYGLLSMILIPLFLLQLNLHYHLPIMHFSYQKIVGFLLVLGGFLVLVYCARLFVGLGNGSPWPFDPPKTLVTTGIYRYSRNPQFIASAFIWIGEFIFFGFVLLFFYALAWIIFNHLVLVLYDEKQLAKKFGDVYIQYIKSVPRYF